MGSTYHSTGSMGTPNGSPEHVRATTTDFERAPSSPGQPIDPNGSSFRSNSSFNLGARKRRPSYANIAASIDTYRSKLEAAPLHDDADYEHGEHGCGKSAITHGIAWVTFGLFTMGAIVLLILWMTLDVENKHAFVGTFFVCSIASCAYFAKCTGMGEIKVMGTKVPLARYVDWVATTPLMLYELCHIGGADESTTLMVVGCDVLMMASGIFSAVVDRNRYPRLMLVWFFIGCLFYGIMLYTLHVEVANGSVLSKPAKVQELFHHLEVLTVVMWSFYPVVVFLGRAQCLLITKDTEDAMLCILDCLSKLGMEGLIVAYCGFIVEGSGGSSGGSSGSDGSSGR